MLTNEQIVAELGWTRKAIRSILGITPLVMRPPFGDIGQLFSFSYLSLNSFVHDEFFFPFQMIVFVRSVWLWV